MDKFGKTNLSRIKFCKKNPKMAATVGLIKNITEALLGIGEVSIDNFTFKLFYKW